MEGGDPGGDREEEVQVHHHHQEEGQAEPGHTHAHPLQELHLE